MFDDFNVCLNLIFLQLLCIFVLPRYHENYQFLRLIKGKHGFGKNKLRLNLLKDEHKFGMQSIQQSVSV